MDRRRFHSPAAVRCRRRSAPSRRSPAEMVAVLALLGSMLLLTGCPSNRTEEAGASITAVVGPGVVTAQGTTYQVTTFTADGDSLDFAITARVTAATGARIVVTDAGGAGFISATAAGFDGGTFPAQEDGGKEVTLTLDDDATTPGRVRLQIEASVGGNNPTIRFLEITIIGPPDALNFFNPPTTVDAAQESTYQVEIVDSLGRRNTQATDTVDVAILTDPSVGATLGGTVSVAAVDGLATFGDLTIDLAGPGFVLRATAGGLTDGNSPAFTVRPYISAVRPNVLQPSVVTGMLIDGIPTGSTPTVDFDGDAGTNVTEDAVGDYSVTAPAGLNESGDITATFNGATSAGFPFARGPISPTIAAGSFGQDGSIDAAGRHVAFSSIDETLVPGDTNGFRDVFVYDRWTGDVERVSVATDGTQGNGTSDQPAISGNGMYVAFRSQSTTFVDGDGNASSDVFVHNRMTGTTTLVSAKLNPDDSRTIGDLPSRQPSISYDGMRIAFTSEAANLVADDVNAQDDVFLFDMGTMEVTLVSQSSTGVRGTIRSENPAISGDGKYVAFSSPAAELHDGGFDNNNVEDVFVRDIAGGTTERVSVDHGGIEGNDASLRPSISHDGRYIAFESDASNLLGEVSPGVDVDSNGVRDIFVVDMDAETIERASLDDADAPTDQDCFEAQIQERNDTWLVIFATPATLVAADVTGNRDIYLRDNRDGSTHRLSQTRTGVGANFDCFNPMLAHGGAFAVFDTIGNNLVAGDSGNLDDVFVIGIPRR
jgi:Tol biopolymer transport system component